MKLPISTRLAKLNAFLALVALTLFIIAFSSNYWLQKNFDFPVNAGGVVTMPVDARIGLFTACKTEFYEKTNKTSSGCSPDGAAEWQFISAGLNIVGLVFSFVGALLLVLGILLQKAAGKIRLKLAIVLCYFIACGFSVGPLLMFPINSKIQVRPNLSKFQVDFDLAWAYTVSAVSVGILALLLFLNIVDIICSHNPDKNDKEDQVAFSKGYNVS